MIDSGYKLNGRALKYSIETRGYTIYLDETPWIMQVEPYIPNRALSYEQNAIAQIKEIVGDTADMPKTDSERLADLEAALQRSQEELKQEAIDSYTMELMEQGIL